MSTKHGALEFMLCTSRGVAMANVTRAGSKDTWRLQVQRTVLDGAGLQQGTRWWPRQLLQVLLRS